MNGRVEHNTASYTTNREQVILSLRKSLDPLLSKLSQDVPVKSHAVQELDESIEGFLTFVGSKFSLWIFDNFMDSTALQTELWVSFFYPVVNRYRTEVIGKYKDLFKDEQQPVAMSQGIKRFDKICKHVGHFYKQFITRVIENFGFTPQLHYVVSILHLMPSRANSTPPANEKLAPTLHLSVHDSLCHLGDLSRYRTVSTINSASNLDFTHALIYYTTAFRIQPSSGMPLNQLGNIFYSTGDIFSGTYYFLRSVAVDEPFRDGSLNLRIVLRKLLKIKDSSLAKLSITGISSKEEEVKVNSDNEAEENDDDYDDRVTANARKSKENVAEVKETMMRLLQVYSNYYMLHLPGTKTGGVKSDHRLSQTLQIELTDKIYDLVKARLIPSKILVKLAITGITFVWLLEQAKEREDAVKPLTAYESCVGLTLRILDKLLSATIAIASQDEFGILAGADSNRVKPGIGTLLPVFRIYFDWLNKQAQQMRISEWGQSSTQCNALFLKTEQVLEYLRKGFGFQFDVVTAVARSNWDRFDDVMKQPQDGSSFGTSTAETDYDSESWRDKPSTQQQQQQQRQKDRRRLLYENDEETQCSGLLAIHGGLNDTPSGLAAVTRLQRAAQEKYRSQCLLFTGVEISRLSTTFLELDEFAGDRAEFNFAMMSFDEEQEEDDALVVEVEDDNESGEIDESEIYNLVGRGAIPAVLQTHAGSKSSRLPAVPSAGMPTHFTGNPPPTGPAPAALATPAAMASPGEPVISEKVLPLSAADLEKKQAQFMARPGSSAQSVNASASPQFLRKLRALEYKGESDGSGASGGRRRGQKRAGSRGQRNNGFAITAPNTNNGNNGNNGGRGRKGAGGESGISGRAAAARSHGSLGNAEEMRTARNAEEVVEIDDSEDESDDDDDDDDSSDEEIVFMGRARAKQ